MITVASFETIGSVFNINHENNSFSITLPGYCSSQGGQKAIKKLRELLDLREENDIKQHVDEVRKRGNQLKMEANECKFSDLDACKNETIEELKNIENNNFEDWTFMLELTSTEIIKEPGIFR